MFGRSWHVEQLTFTFTGCKIHHLYSLINVEGCLKNGFLVFFSGDVFVGRKGKNTNPHNMNMFGHFIVKAVFLQLIEDYKIDSSDTKVQSQ